MTHPVDAMQTFGPPRIVVLKVELVAGVGPPAGQGRQPGLLVDLQVMRWHSDRFIRLGDGRVCHLSRF